MPGRWRWCPQGGRWGQRGRTLGANSPCELYSTIFFGRESKHVCGNNSSMRTWTLAGKLKIARDRWPSYSRLLAIRVCKVTIWNEQQHQFSTDYIDTSEWVFCGKCLTPNRTWTHNLRIQAECSITWAKGNTVYTPFLMLSLAICAWATIFISDWCLNIEKKVVEAENDWSQVELEDTTVLSTHCVLLWYMHCINLFIIRLTLSAWSGISASPKVSPKNVAYSRLFRFTTRITTLCVSIIESWWNHAHVYFKVWYASPIDM